MDELVKLVAQKAGISEAQAKTAVDVVLGFVKQRLPGPVAGQIDSALGGGGGSIGDMAKGLGGMLGGR